MSAVEARVSHVGGEALAPAHIPWGFAEVFIVSQTALPALLYLPGSQAFRLPIRFSAFAISQRMVCGVNRASGVSPASL